MATGQDYDSNRDRDQRLAKLEERVYNFETNLERHMLNLEANLKLQLQLSIEQIRSDINKRQGRTDIANNLVFGVCTIILVAFATVIVGYFIGRPPLAPVSIHQGGGTR